MIYAPHDRPAAVLFDWNDTLAHTRPVVGAALQQILDAHKLDDWEDVKRRRDPHKSLKENFVHFFDAEKADVAYDAYLDAYRHLLSAGLQEMPGAIALVDRLCAAGCPVFVISNKEKSLLAEEAALLFPQNPFQKILGNGAAARNKPHPDPVELALRDTGLSPATHTIWLVGDSMQDVDCALASGCIPVLVGPGKFMREYAEPDKRIRRFADMPALHLSLVAPHGRADLE